MSGSRNRLINIEMRVVRASRINVNGTDMGAFPRIREVRLDR